jgi:hypothetical protein
MEGLGLAIISVASLWEGILAGNFMKFPALSALPGVKSRRTYNALHSTHKVS